MDTVLVLTPLKNAAKYLDTYVNNLSDLSYPKEYLNLAFLESDSIDGTYEKVQKLLPILTKNINRIRIWKKDFGFSIPKGMSKRDPRIQVKRRSILAKSRNYLLSKALEDEDWVLWHDVDLIHYPGDIIETLLKTKKDIVHPNCVTADTNHNFDLNAWRDQGRLHMDDLKSEGDLVRLDSVGGTMLLVKADHHREGLVFPTFPYGKKSAKIRDDNYWIGEIETEGMGIMASDMGIDCWGMPNLKTVHAIN